MDRLALRAVAYVVAGSKVRLGRPSPQEVHHHRDQEQHQEDVEQDLGYADRRAGDGGETQDAGDQCDHQECEGPTEHDVSPSTRAFTRWSLNVRGAPAVPRLR